MSLIVLSVAREPTLMENAPEWKESVATESEADVSAVSVCLYPCVTCSQYQSFLFAQQIKAEREPDVSPEILKEETAEWVRTHKDKDGSIPTQ